MSQKTYKLQEAKETAYRNYCYAMADHGLLSRTTERARREYEQANREYMASLMEDLQK